MAKNSNHINNLIISYNDRNYSQKGKLKEALLDGILVLHYLHTQKKKDR